METGTAYQNYLSASKDYIPSQGRTQYQAPYTESFEEIYKKAEQEDIKLSNAKEFLKSLSSAEMTTLQKYSSLADSIDINNISNEGAYNLLMHDNERYDFDNDGVVEVGRAKTTSVIPTNMPKQVQEAYIGAINSLSDKDRMNISLLTLDPARLNAMLNNTTYTPTKMDYDYLKTQVENHLNPPPGGYTSPEAKESYRKFWEAFDLAYKTEDTTQSTQTQKEEHSSEVAQFLKDLREKGAAGYLAYLNKKKIDEKVEEYKKQLIAAMGDSPETMQKIEEMVDEYKKQLMEEMKEKMEEEQKNKKQRSATPLEILMKA